MFEATLTVFALIGVVGACSAGLLALPWTDIEVRQSVMAWATLGSETKRLGRLATSRPAARRSAPTPANPTPLAAVVR